MRAPRSRVHLPRGARCAHLWTPFCGVAAAGSGRSTTVGHVSTPKIATGPAQERPTGPARSCRRSGAGPAQPGPAPARERPRTGRGPAQALPGTGFRAGAPRAGTEGHAGKRAGFPSVPSVETSGGAYPQNGLRTGGPRSATRIAKTAEAFPPSRLSSGLR
ncbi:hypothetical protein APASM_1143 [Actinosynnema pretiosum subsp. pretiosum]|nr:hypothetical protein APASM_1143 [Actinosynnema pretiosum subsp. pretiosum]